MDIKAYMRRTGTRLNAHWSMGPGPSGVGPRNFHVSRGGESRKKAQSRSFTLELVISMRAPLSLFRPFSSLYYCLQVAIYTLSNLSLLRFIVRPHHHDRRPIDAAAGSARRPSPSSPQVAENHGYCGHFPPIQGRFKLGLKLWCYSDGPVW